MNLPRSSGVQLHPTSLPGGRLGPEAYAFVDWLADAGQTWWQMLPLGPPDRHGSPYKSASAFAASPALLAEPSAPVSRAEELDLREREAFWIEDWADFAGGDAIADQVRFDREWAALRAYGAERGVRLIGDIPIYVAPGSADQRAHPELFRDDAVAGVPPDAYTDKGQLWGNPLYDWPALQRRGYRWWAERFRRVFELYDVARIDHFRGFVAYWAVPKGARYALEGRWRRGPGRAVFDAARRSLDRDLPLIAEDLGVITPAVERLRDDLELPGMVVLQFGFDPGDRHSTHRPENHVERAVVYTGTHDHDTIRGWYESVDDATRAEADAAIDAAGLREPEPHWSLIRLAFASPARVAMIQAQDVLGLGSEARMNMPGRADGAWKWRLRDGALTADHARRLRAATEAAGRLSS
ncbi:MAG: 4-alpha-glucanotransferase [Solirubrobacteraceae bacterium]|nr:4-alpha-glucanotransferase [Solirubrobacteraceae bacterium]